MDLTKITDPVMIQYGCKETMSQSSQGWDNSFIYLSYLPRMTACSDHLFLHCFLFSVRPNPYQTGASEPIYRVGIETQTWENRCVYMWWQGAGRMNWASGTDIHKLPCRTDSWCGRLLDSAASLAGHSGDGQRGGMGRLEAPEEAGCMPTYSWFILLCSRN